MSAWGNTAVAIFFHWPNRIIADIVRTFYVCTYEVNLQYVCLRSDNNQKFPKGNTISKTNKFILEI